MEDPATREREMLALEEVCREWKIQEGWIITQDHEEEVERQGCVVHCIPFWKWAATQPKAIK